MSNWLNFLRTNFVHPFLETNLKSTSPIKYRSLETSVEIPIIGDVRSSDLSRLIFRQTLKKIERVSRAFLLFFLIHFVRMKNRREPRQEERISTFQEGVFENFRNGKHRPVFCPRRRTNISNGAKLAMIFFTTCKLTARWIWLSSPGEHFSSPSRNFLFLSRHSSL